MLNVEASHIVESLVTSVNMDLDDVMQRSLKDVMLNHYDILERYIKHGKNFDYAETTYYHKFSDRTKAYSHKATVKRINAFFQLFNKIKREGFKEKIDPLLVIDLRPFQPLDPCKESLKKPDGSCVDFMRCNGSHRCAIAKILNIDNIPVIRIELKVVKDVE